MFTDPLLDDRTWRAQDLIGRRTRPTSTYGLRQEELLLRLVEKNADLAVCHSSEIDRNYKLDAIVLHRRRPDLPAVGLQFTTKHSTEKQVATLDAVARSSIVVRLLYLETAEPVGQEVAQRVVELIRHVADQPAERAAVFARVYRDHSRKVVVDVVQRRGLIPVNDDKTIV